MAMQSKRHRQRLMIDITAILLAFSAVMSMAQKQPREVADAPAQVSSTARIAPAGEPGTALVIAGTVVAADGKTPAAGVVVYAYHTDADGYYQRTGQSGEAGENQPRLRGWAKTDANGHFEFITIKPAPYPNRDIPAHVHVQAWGAGYPRQWFELEFEGDPLLPKQHFTDNTAEYLYIEPVTRDNQGVLHCSFTMRMRSTSNFRAGQ
jgi:protocatechuate 3,4-dioxygenase beta subunit